MLKVAIFYTRCYLSVAVLKLDIMQKELLNLSIKVGKQLEKTAKKLNLDDYQKDILDEDIMAVFNLEISKIKIKEENKSMKKSAYQVWNLAKEQNLNEEQTKELMIKEGIIIKKQKEKTPIQKAISSIEETFELNAKNVFLREQAKRIRWKLENLLIEEKQHFITFYNQGGADMLQDETFGLQRFLEKYEDYVINEDERSN